MRGAGGSRAAKKTRFLLFPPPPQKTNWAVVPSPPFFKPFHIMLIVCLRTLAKEIQARDNQEFQNRSFEKKKNPFSVRCGPIYEKRVFRRKTRKVRRGRSRGAVPQIIGFPLIFFPWNLLRLRGNREYPRA